LGLSECKQTLVAFHVESVRITYCVSPF